MVTRRKGKLQKMSRSSGRWIVTVIVAIVVMAMAALVQGHLSRRQRRAQEARLAAILHSIDQQRAQRWIAMKCAMEREAAQRDAYIRNYQREHPDASPRTLQRIRDLRDNWKSSDAR